MATPMTPAQWRGQLDKFGVPFREIPGWDLPNSGRDDETGLKFGPVHGAMIHHTGSDSPDRSNRALIRDGRPDLAGPLAHGGLNDDGVIDLFTAGRANHAGGGDPDVLRAVINESYRDYPPPPDKHQGEPGAVDGNDSLYGLEVYYFKILTPGAYNSAVGWSAAICDFHDWSPKSVIGHKEWSDWKSDPNLIDMKDFRRDVENRLKGRVALIVPARPTPNITKAIKANIAYDKALDRIKARTAQDEVESARKEIKKQRRELRGLERK